MRPSESCCSCFALAALATGLDYVSCSPPFQVPISKARCVAGSGKTRWCSKHLTRERLATVECMARAPAWRQTGSGA